MFTYLNEDVLLQEDLENICLKHHSLLEKLNNSTVFVTGATGLVGSLLVKALLYHNDKAGATTSIVCLVRSVDKAKLIFGDILGRSDLKLVVGDVRSDLTKIMSGISVDYVLHAASVTTSKVMVEEPVSTVEVAVIGTNNVLKLARANKVKSFVYISSMEVYGQTEKTVVREEDIGYINPLDVRSNYPESKRMCENLCIAYLKQYNIPIKIARLAQTFGPGILPGENRVFAQFARSVIQQKDIVLHTTGESEGNYCYTRDSILGILTILLKGADGEAYNVSNEATHTTIIKMAKMVASKLADDKIDVKLDIPQENKYGYAKDTKLFLSSEKLRRLGWTPTVELQEAFQRLITSMKASTAS